MQDFRQEFTAKYQKQPLIAIAPGRVNLIGEHTDYNDGFVLPASVNKYVRIGVAENNTDTVRAFALNYNEEKSFPVASPEPSGDWSTYLKGVVALLQEKTNAIRGVDILIESDVPVGAGMSSSAALCSALALALNELFQLKLNQLEQALIGQQTEHRFAGVKCGIMDQFASLHGKANSVIKLDCRDMSWEYFPFSFSDYSIVLINSMVSHSLASSEYNIRRAQCEEGVSLLRKFFPDISSLRDLSNSQVVQHKNDLPPLIFKRCSYVTAENERVTEACTALLNGDLSRFGKLVIESHRGLSEEYEVSCRELDFLAHHAISLPGVAGSRMMGGGFGGCTINLVQEKYVEPFVSAMKATFHKEFGIDPDHYVMKIEDGARIVSE
ncbi:MAG TPA: galactokinase [Parasegetibacter sp.]